eukprot:c18664_g1_i1.p1 GENE.c18664_g1_i1~~c18664_g1_i1.p1  ORF type:complete len:147 (+),score=26.41 c18664_g1_i1:170-610(+)
MRTQVDPRTPRSPRAGQAQSQAGVSIHWGSTLLLGAFVGVVSLTAVCLAMYVRFRDEFCNQNLQLIALLVGVSVLVSTLTYIPFGVLRAELTSIYAIAFFISTGFTAIVVVVGFFFWSKAKRGEHTQPPTSISKIIKFQNYFKFKN